MICKDIETYVAWPVKSSNPYLAVRGIFFDETPQQYDAHSFAYLQKLTEFVKGPHGLGSDSYVSDHLFPLSSFVPSIFILYLREGFFYHPCVYISHFPNSMIHFRAPMWLVLPEEAAFALDIV